MSKAPVKLVNPIARYQEVTKMPWADISRRTGISPQTLSDLKMMSPFQLDHVRLKTVYALKKYLGVDLVKFLEELDKQRT